MEIQFAKWGNSLAIRVPSKVADSLGVVPGTVADLEVRGGQFIVTPRKQAYRLDDLLAEITPENLHSEISVGPNVGMERND